MNLSRPPRRRTGRIGGVLFAPFLVFLLIRVAIITTLWTGLFLGAMFGYLTAPFVLLLGFIAVYAVIDRYRAARRRAEDRRRVILGDEPGPLFEADRP